MAYHGLEVQVSYERKNKLFFILGFNQLVEIDSMKTNPSVANGRSVTQENPNVLWNLKVDNSKIYRLVTTIY
jgi:hypothetical protein